MTTLGDLTQRVTIEERVTTPDPLGSEIVAWIPVFSVWADVKFANGAAGVAESIQQNGIVAQTSASFRVLNRRGLRPRQRILYNNQIWDIHDIRPDSQRRFTDLVCTQGVNDG
jgi:SPP1 family predicted phage head-tail adaptor